MSHEIQGGPRPELGGGGGPCGLFSQIQT